MDLILLADVVAAIAWTRCPVASNTVSLAWKVGLTIVWSKPFESLHQLFPLIDYLWRPILRLIGQVSSLSYLLVE